MELASLVSGAITNAPKQIEFLPVNAVLLEGVRQNDKRPAWIKISVPDAWVVNLMKNEKLLEGFLMVKVVREFIDSWWAKPAESTEGGEGNNGSQESTEVCGEVCGADVPGVEGVSGSVFDGVPSGTGVLSLEQGTGGQFSK